MSQAPNARKQDKTVTLKTLAAHLSLDPATVSVVLNDVPGRSIPDSTRERIKTVARTLGYSPNILARSLRTRRTRTVGVLLPDVLSSYHAQILSGVANHLAQFDYCCMILPHGHDSSLVAAHVDSLQKRGAEGIIAIDTALDNAPQLSTVAVGCQSHTPGATLIQLNQERAVALALEFVLSQGHRELLVIKKDDFDIYPNGLVRIVLKGAAAHGVQVVYGRTASLGTESRIVEEAVHANHQPSMGLDTFKAILALDIDAARTAKRAFLARETSADLKVSIVCIDNEKNSFVDAAVTVIRQPLRTMGQMAAEILLQKITSDRPLPELITVEPEVVVTNTPFNT
jgi:DNA-binding LacI/PurR family transcriptional regulator